MPTQRAHGGAALIPINLTAPAFAGLNTEREATLLGQEWATVLKNVIFDSSGRVSVRTGWTSSTTSAVAGVVLRIHEYVKADGTSEIISSTDADIFSGTTSPSSVEGTLGISEGHIKFVNFNDKCIAIGVGTSGNPAVYTGTGNFTTITVNSGTAPTGTVGTAAFGRLWCVDTDGKTIRYSALLDETRWAVVDGGGTIDMSKVWPSGQDAITAIAELAGDLVVFGKENIVIWTDGSGSALGIDPTTIYVSDTFPGMGCISQFAVTRAVGDLWFVSSSGLQSMRRALQDRTTPTNNVTQNVQSSFLQYVDAESDPNDMTLVYSPREDFVLAVFPTSNKIMYFNTKRVMQDRTYRTAEWTGDLQTATYRASTRGLLGSLTGTVGEIMTYSGFDDDGTTYDFSYESGWLDFGEELNGYIKIIKKMSSFVFIQSATSLNFTIKYDFNTNPRTTSITVEGGGGAEYSLGEWSLGEYSGGTSIRTLSIPGQGSGQFVKVGVNLNTTNSRFALQQINLYAKVGRIA
jgi:hypothetical protein